MGKRELVTLLNLSSWCLVMVERLFLAVPRGCLWFVIVVIPDHTHYVVFTLKNATSLSLNNIAIRQRYDMDSRGQFAQKMWC